MAGLTSQGFVPALLTEIRDAFNASLKAAFGSTFKVDRSASVVGQFTAILSAALASAWEALESIASLDPADREGADLVALCALTGTVPLDPEPSTVTLTLMGTAGTVVPIGSTVSVEGTRDKFDTTAAGTLVAVTPWATSTAYTVGQRRTSSGNVYVCVIAGTSDASTALSGTGSNIPDGGGTLRWDFMGTGTAAVDVAAESQELDAIVGTSGTINTIESPVSGWTSVYNLLDADEGFAAETDAALRERRIVELAGGGAGTPDSIRTALRRVDEVTYAHVFFNRTDTADGDGVPAHGIEAIVVGGADQDICDALATQVDAGDAMAGAEVGTSVDSEGVAQTYKFSRPTEVPLYLTVEITTGTGYPADGDDQIKAAVLALAESLHGVGDDVHTSRLYSAVFSVAGVTQIDNFFVGTAPTPVAVSQSITARQLATFDTSRIEVD